VPIRQGLRSDLDELVALETQCFESDQLSRRSLRYFLTVPNAALLVADMRGVVAGYALVAFRKGSQIARLYSIAIGPDFRGRNLGLALLKAGEKAARMRGARLMRLEGRSRNRRAIGLYEREGYCRYSRIEDYYEDGATALCYEKTLSK
jgi:[ribosomal protein S18]-alanine N-acetyltransferase